MVKRFHTISDQGVPLDASTGIPNYTIVECVVASDYDVLAERCERLEAALRGVLPYVATEVLESCNGNKCREPWCAGCNGDETAKDAAEQAMSNYRAAHNLLSGISGGKDG